MPLLPPWKQKGEDSPFHFLAARALACEMGSTTPTKDFEFLGGMLRGRESIDSTDSIPSSSSLHSPAVVVLSVH